MRADVRELIPAIALALGLPAPPLNWVGIDALWPLLERMRADGAVVTIKLDGGRGPDLGDPYSCVVTCGALADDDYVRSDVSPIESALAEVVVDYARRGWGVELDA